MSEKNLAKMLNQKMDLNGKKSYQPLLESNYGTNRKNSTENSFFFGNGQQNLFGASNQSNLASSLGNRSDLGGDSSQMGGNYAPFDQNFGYAPFYPLNNALNSNSSRDNDYNQWLGVGQNGSHGNHNQGLAYNPYYDPHNDRSVAGHPSQSNGNNKNVKNNASNEGNSYGGDYNGLQNEGQGYNYFAPQYYPWMPSFYGQNFGGFGQQVANVGYQDSNMNHGMYAPFGSATDSHPYSEGNEASEEYYENGDYDNEYDGLVKNTLEDFGVDSLNDSSSAFGNVLETSSMNSLKNTNELPPKNDNKDELRENELNPALDFVEVKVQKEEEPPKPKGPKSWADIANLKPTEIASKPAPVAVSTSLAKKPEVAKNGPLQGINTTTIDLNPPFARFFVIKSYSEDDVHKSIKYGIWASTDSGNKRLDKAFNESASKGPIYLFFSVNASGQFCGMAQMMTALDYNTKSDVWALDKWNGMFQVKWIFVKDVPNSHFRHIRLKNNENKQVTNSRDTQEVFLEPGIEVLKIISSFKAKTSILDDFSFYDKKQEETKEKKKNTEGKKEETGDSKPSSAPSSLASSSESNGKNPLSYSDTSVGAKRK